MPSLSPSRVLPNFISLSFYFYDWRQCQIHLDIPSTHFTNISTAIRVGELFFLLSCKNDDDVAEWSHKSFPLVCVCVFSVFILKLNSTKTHKKQASGEETLEQYHMTLNSFLSHTFLCFNINCYAVHILHILTHADLSDGRITGDPKCGSVAHTHIMFIFYN